MKNNYTNINYIKPNEKNISKHIGENSEESINNGSTKFYLGTPDYPIIYVPQIKKWVVEFPDGRIYDIRDIQE
jgi:hypothetical protein